MSKVSSRMYGSSSDQSRNGSASPSRGASNGATRTRSKTSSPAQSAASPKKRVRFGPLPKPAETIEVPYALSRPELRDLSDGELTMVLANTKAFRDNIGRICEKLDAKRGRKGGKRGTEPLYSAWECELVFLYQFVCGLRSLKEARDRLAGDRGAEARRLFGLDRPRGDNPNRARCLREGVQSEATLCRHKRRFGERRRRGAYERLLRDLTIEHATEFPAFREEARLLALDGTKIETHFTAPIWKKPKKGAKNQKPTLVNPDSITCADGGYVPRTASPDKAGHGYSAMILTTMSGLPLGHEITPLNAYEAHTGTRVIERFAKEFQPLLETDQVGVLAADGAFTDNCVRKAAREAGYLENIHAVSHSPGLKSKARAERETKRRIRIQDHPNWFSNGHGELVCKCGQGQIRKEISRRQGKPVVARTVGTCPTCGPISITAGLYKGTQNKKGDLRGFDRIQPGEQESASQAFGNPLTFHDPLSKIYGYKRRAHGEGLNGVLASRFGLNKGKRWFRRMDQARTETAIVFSIMHALAMEQRRRAAAAERLAPGASTGDGLAITPAAATGPPGSALAA